MNINVQRELERQQAEALAEERKDFVRRAAVAYATATDPSASTRNGFACFACNPREAVIEAKRLWEELQEAGE